MLGVREGAVDRPGSHTQTLRRTGPGVSPPRRVPDPSVVLRVADAVRHRRRRRGRRLPAHRAAAAPPAPGGGEPATATWPLATTRRVASLPGPGVHVVRGADAALESVFEPPDADAPRPTSGPSPSRSRTPTTCPAGGWSNASAASTSTSEGQASVGEPVVDRQVGALDLAYDAGGAAAVGEGVQDGATASYATVDRARPRRGPSATAARSCGRVPAARGPATDVGQVVQQARGAANVVDVGREADDRAAGHREVGELRRCSRRPARRSARSTTSTSGTRWADRSSAPASTSRSRQGVARRVARHRTGDRRAHAEHGAPIGQPRDQPGRVVVASRGRSSSPPGRAAGCHSTSRRPEELARRSRPAGAGRQAARRHRASRKSVRGAPVTHQETGRPAAYGASMAGPVGLGRGDDGRGEVVVVPGPQWRRCSSFLGVGERHGRAEGSDRRAAAQPARSGAAGPDSGWSTSVRGPRVTKIGARAEQVVLAGMLSTGSVTTLSPASFAPPTPSARACGSTGRGRRPRRPPGRCPRAGG